MARQHQEGRVTDEVTSVTHDFTEGWFRNSGIYGLHSEFQTELMEWFCEEKNCYSMKPIRFNTSTVCSARSAFSPARRAWA